MPKKLKYPVAWLVALLLTACGGGADSNQTFDDLPEEERYGGTAVIAYISDIPDVNPLTSTETLALTTLGALPEGRPVNLERALRAGDRLGGHLVSGHVDGVGAVASVEDDARAQRWRFTAPRALMRYIATKGSICVDGTSLTINAVDAAGFEVALVPHTIANTAFNATSAGDPVNLEVDQVARYVERLLQEQSQ